MHVIMIYDFEFHFQSLQEALLYNPYHVFQSELQPSHEGDVGTDQSGTQTHVCQVGRQGIPPQLITTATKKGHITSSHHHTIHLYKSLSNLVLH